jgi:hypothetical protein
MRWLRTGALPGKGGAWFTGEPKLTDEQRWKWRLLGDHAIDALYSAVEGEAR